MTSSAERCALLARAVRNPDAVGLELELPEGVSEGVGGRVIFGTEEEDFAFLSGETQPYPFVVGPDDLISFCTKSAHIEMMEAIGFERDWVADKVKQGNEFRLVLFPADDFEDGLVSPTWDNILSLVTRECPQAGEKLNQYLPELKSTPYSELIKKIGFDIDHIPSEIYVRVNTFQNYGDSQTPNDLAHARSFLRATLKCTALFSGDGFAYSETGERGVREWLVKRVAISDLPGVQWVNLNV